MPGAGLIGLALLLAALALPNAASAEPPAPFWKSCESSSEEPPTDEAGQCSVPRGIGVDPSTPGHLYVADMANDRIVELTAWGQFVRAWGWGVRDGAEELQVCDAETGCQEGLRGVGTGQLAAPRGVAVDSAGAVHVVDLENRRIQKFGPEGQFLAAYGGDVVAHGPSDSSNDETQELSIAASEGTFKLSFTNPFPEGGKAQTASLPYNASAAEVEAALNALTTIGGIGGSVSVTGGPGDATGSAPYEVSFEGNLGGDDVPRLELDRSELAGDAIGGTLRCSSGTTAPDGPDPTIEFSWLRNGIPIPGAESPTYTTVAADEGKAIQCRVRTENAQGGGALQVANPVYVAPPVPATVPPVAPSQVELTMKLNEHLTVGGLGGQTLTCNPGSWPPATSFAYEWYRNGAKIAGEEGSTYVVSAEDLASPGIFQCAAIGSNVGGATVKLNANWIAGSGIAGNGTTNPPPTPGSLLRDLVPHESMEPPSNVHTTNQGGAGEVCSAAAGDTCKAGAEGDAPGFFGAWPVSSFIAIDHKGTLESDADDVVYLGDADRIQEFDADGSYQGEVALPEEGTVSSLAVDQASGDLYFSYVSPIVIDANGLPVAERPNVHRLGPVTEIEVGSLEVGIPTAIATDAEGHVYVADDESTDTKPAINPGEHSKRILVFDAAGNLLEAIGETGFNSDFGSLLPQEFDRTTGIAAGSACLGEGADVYLANTNQQDSFVRAWGPPPDDPDCPPKPSAPSIEASYAVSVGTEEARVEALINPHFWSGPQGTTRYYVQYATAECVQPEPEGAVDWQAPCVKSHPAPPGAVLEGGVLDTALPATVLLGGLDPATAYRFRFAAESKDSKEEPEPTVPGQPVFGVGGEPFDEDGGEERAFRTFAEPQPPPECPNDAFRSGPSAALPDCRAYELVSPLDKAGGDIATSLNGTSGDLARHSQAATSGGALTYSSYRAFADPKGVPFSSQYIARRTSGGWATENVSAPQEGSELAFGFQGVGTLYRHFSPELAEGWIMTATDPPLAPGGQEEYVNLYRRDNATGAFEACTTERPPTSPGSGSLASYLPVLQGVAAGGGTAVFRANDKLTDEASDAIGATEGGSQPIEQLYACTRVGGGERRLQLASFLPAGVAGGESSTAGAGGFLDRYGRNATLAGALSADGARLYWSAGGRLYLRENPAEPQSPQQHGSAQGEGDTIGPAQGTGRTFKGGTTITSVEVEEGAFGLGQEVTAKCPEKGGVEVLAAGTTIISPPTGSLKISPAAPEGCLEAEIVGLASDVVSGASASFGAFAPGQRIEGEGIAPGTRIEAVEGEELTLSDPATATGAEVALEAFSGCSQPERGCTHPVSPSGSGAAFWAASPDGAAALFTQGGALWRFDAASGDAHEIAPEVKGLAGWSEDLSRVYLASGELLTGEEPGEASSEKRFPVEGALNLYLYEAGEGGGFAFIGTLAPSDGASPNLSPIAKQPNLRISRATPDGARLAFTSSARLTEYDNADRASGSPAAEVYLYDAAAAKLRCASCNPSGARPAALAVKRSRFTSEAGVFAAAHLPPWMNSFHATRALSDDGRRLFFNAEDALALGDINGAQDVYQWEAPGAGDCTESSDSYSEQNGGCVELISSGRSGADSEFVDADRTGTDVFFSTARSLLPHDPGLIDIYDAREGGGLDPPPDSPAPCEGEACQSAPGAPEPVTPASSLARGEGNLPATGAASRCSRAARKARSASRRARRMLRAAKRSEAPGSARRMRRAAKRNAKRAKRLAQASKRCRARTRPAARGQRRSAR